MLLNSAYIRLCAPSYRTSRRKFRICWSGNVGEEDSFHTHTHTHMPISFSPSLTATKRKNFFAQVFFTQLSLICPEDIKGSVVRGSEKQRKREREREKVVKIMKSKLFLSLFFPIFTKSLPRGVRLQYCRTKLIETRDTKEEIFKFFHFFLRESLLQ
jgi:hypothetical protein